MKRPSWIAVDLDGTLAHYLPGEYREKGAEYIGKPILPMVQRVKRWRAAGKVIKIFTARAYEATPSQLKAIENWCLEHLGEVLPITNIKDYDCEAFYDDRGYGVERNKGHLIGKAHDE